MEKTRRPIIDGMNEGEIQYEGKVKQNSQEERRRRRRTGRRARTWKRGRWF